MLKRFVAAWEDRPGVDWFARFVNGRAEAERWYLGQGLAPPPTVDQCRAALREHMPELIPHYDSACALVGDDDLARRVLSQFRPPRQNHACSQAVWIGADGPALVRNFDYPLDIVSERFEMTSWSGRKVISKGQRPWGGCLDGMNEDGLVASLTSAGRQAQGRGFSIILIIRYVLETCHHVGQAVDALSRIPVALPQTVLDRSGDYATLFLGPDQTPVVSRLKACTNHQVTSDAAPDSIGRQQILLQALAEPSMSLDELTSRFLEPPLYSRQIKSPTVYTAVYRPALGQVDYIWPGRRWRQRFDHFESGEYTHDYGELAR